MLYKLIAVLSVRVNYITYLSMPFSLEATICLILSTCAMFWQFNELFFQMKTIHRQGQRVSECEAIC